MMNIKNVILHVEDDLNDVELVKIVFRKTKVAGHLAVVGDGEQAISYLEGEGIYADRGLYPFPELVLLDIKLPRKSGLEVLAWLRSQTQSHLKRLPVVMLTSSNQPHDVKTAYDLGANSYLVKPGELNKLTELITLIHQYWLGANTKPVIEEPKAGAMHGGAAPPGTRPVLPDDWMTGPTTWQWRATIGKS